MENRTDALSQRFLGFYRLYSKEFGAYLAEQTFAVVGVGGVGSWAVEALARSGVGKLVLIDADDACVNNTNRQLTATKSTLGQFKVDILAKRVQDINPHCQVSAIQRFLTADSIAEVLPENTVGIFDAIDSVENKALLVRWCADRKVALVVAGAAGGKRSAVGIRSCDLSQATHDPLLASLRRSLRKNHGFPQTGKFGVDCVYCPTPAIPPPPAECEAYGSEAITPRNGDIEAGGIAARGSRGARLDCGTGYGNAAYVTGVYGLVGAGLLVDKLWANFQPQPVA